MKQILIKLFLLSILVIQIQGNNGFQANKNDIQFNLIRRQNNENIWEQLNPSDDICHQQLNDNPKLVDINLPEYCSNDYNAKISINCEQQDISYNIMVYLNSTDKDQFKKYDKNDKSLQYELSVDLNQPWSWVKNEQCRSCNRERYACTEKCYTNTLFNQNEEHYYKKELNCQQQGGMACSLNDKCGIVTVQNEGLAVSGQFSEVYMRFGTEQNRLKAFKMLMVKEMSFQKNLMADGILGLGIEYQQNQAQENQIQGFYQNYEENTGFVSDVYQTFDQVQGKQFSIVLNDENPVLIFGQIDEKYAADLKKHPFKYTSVLLNHSSNNNANSMKDESYQQKSLKQQNKQLQQSQYYKWIVDVTKLEIMEVGQDQKEVKYEQRHVFEEIINQNALLSISSRALVLPKYMIDFIVKKFDEIFQIQGCKVDINRRNFLVCRQLKSKVQLANIMIFITIDNSISLHINPDELLAGCKENSGFYDCMFEIQQSYNDQIILGDVVLRNSYMHFDIENRTVGFAHANNPYMRIVLEKLENLVVGFGQNIMTELEFIIKFYFLIMISIGIFFILKKSNKIMRCVDLFCLKYFKKRLFGYDDIELQRLNVSAQEMEKSVQQTDDDDHFSYRINDMQIEADDQSSTFDDQGFEEI